MQGYVHQSALCVFFYLNVFLVQGRHDNLQNWHLTSNQHNGRGVPVNALVKSNSPRLDEVDIYDTESTNCEVLECVVTWWFCLLFIPAAALNPLARGYYLHWKARIINLMVNGGGLMAFLSTNVVLTCSFDVLCCAQFYKNSLSFQKQAERHLGTIRELLHQLEKHRFSKKVRCGTFSAAFVVSRTTSS